MLKKNHFLLVLGSSSTYRAEILSNIGVNFIQMSPSFSEHILPKESPKSAVIRLAQGKALSLGVKFDQYVIVSSDQIAHQGNRIFNKPGNYGTAFEQLQQCQGEWVSFTSSLYLLRHDGECKGSAETFEVKFRALTDQDIKRYLEVEEPYDCAGSIKVESAGMTLLEDTRGRDINCVYGLPVMLLREELANLKLDLLDFT